MLSISCSTYGLHSWHDWIVDYYPHSDICLPAERFCKSEHFRYPKNQLYARERLKTAAQTGYPALTNSWLVSKNRHEKPESLQHNSKSREHWSTAMLVLQAIPPSISPENSRSTSRKAACCIITSLFNNLQYFDLCRYDSKSGSAAGDMRFVFPCLGNYG